MEWSDQPVQPASFSPEPSVTATASSEAAPKPVLGGARRLAATALLAVGLLGVGGAAVVFAADPSATPAPSAGTQSQPAPNGGGSAPTNPGTRPNGAVPNGPGHAKGNCPNTGGTGGSAPNGSSAPSTNGSTSTPSTSDL